jgi:hypothetical protein
MTKEEVIQSINDQIAICENIIRRMRSEGDLEYLERIKDLQGVVDKCTSLVETYKWDSATKLELLEIYNTILLWAPRELN